MSLTRHRAFVLVAVLLPGAVLAVVPEDANSAR
jgi:hypothetical protein